MRRNLITAAAWVLVCGAGAWSADGPGADDPATVGRLWRQMASADLESAEFKAAQWKLTAILGTMPAARRASAATAMMDPDAESGVNAAALELFGADPLPITDVQRILWDAQRSAEQRELLKTYYSFCRAEAKQSILTESARLQLVDMLAERLGDLAGAKAHYGEQRMLGHLCSAVLSRYARSAEQVTQAKGFLKAMEKYVEKAYKSDAFAAGIPAWLDLIQAPETSLDTFSGAIQCLGHWDPLVRLKAAERLAEKVPGDDKAAQVVLALLNDGRDEVRAAAARVFAVAKDYQPDVVVPKMMAALTEDRGVIVQTAAAETLVARAEQAQGQVDPLLSVLTSPSRWLGRKRTSSVLLVLARLVKGATPRQKAEILKVAALRLTDAPDGALAVFQALGPEAAKAVPSIREYRSTADRFQRVYIDRHVLPAILPDEPPAKND
jgi:hypothetical protein